jgi:hypothetical protein
MASPNGPNRESDRGATKLERSIRRGRHPRTMTSFALPRAVLTCVSELSGDAYSDIGGEDLLAAINGRGFELTMAQLIRAMRELRSAGYVDCTFLGGMSGVELIKLEHRGRQEVEGWPATPRHPTDTDVEALIEVLARRSEDPAVSEQDRSKAGEAAAALRDLGLNVGGQVLGAWLRHVAGVG